MSLRKPPPPKNPPHPIRAPKDHFWQSVAAFVVIIACFAAFLFTCMETWH